jgi:DUF2975 family protein
MTGLPGPRGVASALAAVFTGLWWWLLAGSLVIAALILMGVWRVGVQIGPDGEPNFVAGSQSQMVLPVAFELQGAAAQVSSTDRRNTGTVERATGLLRLATPDRSWIAMTAAAALIALMLWILAELAALCRSVRDGQPFEPANAGRLRRLALAFVLAEVCRAATVYAAHAYAAAHFGADHLRFTASPHLDARAIASALILLVLAEVFRTGTRLDEEQSLTV